MKNRLLHLFIFMLVFCIEGYAQADIAGNAKKETFVYAIKDQDTLRLDMYNGISTAKDKPCVIFAFGGGFMRGNRAAKIYTPFFNMLAKNGYTVISIDYRLGLKKAYEEKKRMEPSAQQKAKTDPQQGLRIFANTINMAVEDLYDATTYIVNHAGEWNIDKNTIVVSGSSAGAITALQGEYALCNNQSISTKLPDGFRYAGVIAFAGAIFTTDGDLAWTKSPAPILLFHGDADKNVPFDKVTIDQLNIGFYGSKHIAGTLDKNNKPYYFYQVENAAHEMAEKPMKDNWGEVLSFLDKLVVNKQHTVINTNVKQLDKPLLEKKFSIFDYMKANGLSLD